MTRLEEILEAIKFNKDYFECRTNIKPNILFINQDTLNVFRIYIDMKISFKGTYCIYDLKIFVDNELENYDFKIGLENINILD